jgi:hypothetical protein
MSSLSLPAGSLRGPIGQNPMALPDRRDGAPERDFARVFAGFGTPDLQPELPRQDSSEIASSDTDMGESEE